MILKIVGWAIMLFLILIAFGMIIYNPDIDVDKVCEEVKGVQIDEEDAPEEAHELWCESFGEGNMKTGVVRLLNKGWVYIVSFGCKAIKVGFWLGERVPKNVLVGKVLFWGILIFWIFGEIVKKIL
jgi:hypothetical protein